VPVTGATPVTTTTAGTGYTGTISWKTGGSPLVGNFAGATTYTATITLTPTGGYTLTGVAANFFTVAGATSVSHSADSGEITAVFPATIKLTQTIIITNFPADITYGVSPTALAAVSTSGLSVAFTTATSLICTVSGTTLTILTVGTCTINANQAGDTNFAAASQVSGSFTISKATPSLSNFAHISKNVGDTSFDLTPPSVANSLPGAFSYTSATTATATISGQTVTIGSAGSTLVTASFTPTDSTRYNNSTITMTLSVGLAAQATLSISSLTINTKTNPYSQALSITTSGGSGTGTTTFAIASGGTASGCALSNSSSTATITATTAGTCLIQASKAADSTYSAATSATVTFRFKTSQRILFSMPEDMTVGGSTQTVVPTVFGSPLQVMLTSTTTGICTVTGFVITAVASGSCSITASQAGDDEYAAAADVIRTFAISGPATATAITIQPTGAGSGSILGTQPVIRIVDSSGNTVTTSAVNVVASISSGTGTLSGTTTVAASSGIATFTNLVLTGTVGAFTLTFTPTSLTSATSNSLTVTAGPASKVAITRAAVGTQRRTAFTTQPQITIQDASDNTITSSTAVVTASITSGAGGSFIGSNTSTAVSGVATFTGLGIDGTIGTTYTITYTVSGLTVATATINLTGTTCNGIFTCQVGDTGPGGGTVFYVSSGTFTQNGATGSMCSTGCKYLEVAPSNWNGASEPTRSWAQSGYQTTRVNNATSPETATATAIGWGYRNTRAIILQGNTNTATSGAALADSHTVTVSGTVYDDWYLPSKDELNQLYSQKETVGGFSSWYYRSSSESTSLDNSRAWVQEFGNGLQAEQLKAADTYYVRPIRAFGVPITISVASISGVTPPVTGATPVSTTTAGTGYTGTVSWSGSPSTFAAATVYTATITLTPTAGYTLTGVTANFFTVAGGAPVTHSANSGVITAVFYMVGSTGPGGGKIFYLNPGGFACGPTRTNGCSYLEVAPGNWNGASDPTKPWALSGYQSTDVSGIANDSNAYNNVLGIGLGYKNSIDIVAQDNNPNTAAGAARAYTGGSKNDWYLPTAAELNLLCQWQGGVAPSVTTLCTFTSTNRSTYGAQSAGFSGDYYWSSSEGGNANAWSQRFASNTGSQANINKFNVVSVRPIRAFGP
jgi:hypothetical protein